MGIKMIIGVKGSASSGNRGHAGRPGKRGGSMPRSNAPTVAAAPQPPAPPPPPVKKEPVLVPHMGYGDVVHVYRDEDNYNDSQVLEGKFKELQSLRKKAGIPAPEYYHSRTVRGWSEVTKSGVEMNLGQDWEKDGYNRSELKRAYEQELKSRKDLAKWKPADWKPAPRKFFWKYPSEIVVKARANHNNTSNDHKDMFDQVMKMAEGLGLKVERNQSGTDGVIKLK